jgi:hypothetical protein
MEIVTANELLSGAVVYVDDSGHWQADINKARIFEADAEAARDSVIAEAHATGRLVSVESEQVLLQEGRVVPVRLRERIRAEGPTAPYGPDRQTLEEGDHVSI